MASTSRPTGIKDAAPSAAAAAAPTTTTDRPEDSPLTYAELLSSLLHFLEVSIHTILHLRHVYPPSIFTLHRSYQIPVHRSRHPGLNEYISSVVGSVREELEKEGEEGRGVKKVVVVLSSVTTGVTIERYVFELAHLLPAPIRRADRDLSIRGNLTFRQVQLYYRAFLMKLVVIDAALEEVYDEEDLTFSVTIVMREGDRPGPGGKDRDRAEEGMWVPADDGRGMAAPVSARARGKQRQRDDSMDGGLDTGREAAAAEDQDDEDDGAIILPVKTLDSGVINVSPHGATPHPHHTADTFLSLPLRVQLMLYVEDNPTAKASLRLAAAGTSGSQSNSASAAQPTQRHHRRRDNKGRRSRNRTRSGGNGGGGGVQAGTQAQGLDVGMDLEDAAAGGPRDIEEALLRDAAGALPSSSKRSGNRKGIARRRKAGRKSGGAAVASDEDRSDSSATDSEDDEGGEERGVRDSRSPSEDERSDVSIESVGDFAGFGGAGAGRGGGGMTAGW